MLCLFIFSNSLRTISKYNWTHSLHLFTFQTPIFTTLSSKSDNCHCVDWLEINNVLHLKYMYYVIP